MSRRLYMSRFACGHTGCSEVANYESSTRADQTKLYQSYGQGRWRCTRHSQPQEVLGAGNPRIIHEQTVYAESYGQFWRGHLASGFTYGPGYKAFAKDFPVGTILRVTAEIILPETPPEDGSHSASDTREARDGEAAERPNQDQAALSRPVETEEVQLARNPGELEASTPQSQGHTEDWRPMDSLPLDGTVVLLSGPEGHVGLGTFEPAGFDASQPSGSVAWCGQRKGDRRPSTFMGGWRAHQATGWKPTPLPAPPSSTEEPRS